MMPPKDHVGLLPDGRELRARQRDPLAPWWVEIVGDPSSRRSDRWLLLAICQVLEKQGRAPAYVFDLVDEIIGVDTRRGRRYPCACCDLFTMEKFDSSSGCAVCGWEDDLVQYRDPTYRGGANKPSLVEARAMYAGRGYVKEHLLRAGFLRPPFDDERPSAGQP